MLEFGNYHTEESFLFRIVSPKGKILVVWENVNDARATHVFLDNQTEGENILDRIEEFICRSDINTKRSMLHDYFPVSNKIKSDLNYVKSIRHLSLESYKAEISMLLR